MKLDELHKLILEDDGAASSADMGGADDDDDTGTRSSNIATVVKPLFSKGKMIKRPSPISYIGQGIYENVKEAHVLDHSSVIYKLDNEDPMNGTEVLVIGGAGRYTLKGLRGKARKEAQALAQDLESDHGGSFRSAAYNINQLTNTLNTIVAAYNELARLRRKGGRGSRGIRNEDDNFIRECIDMLEQYIIYVTEAKAIENSIKQQIAEGKIDPAHANAINGMYHLGLDPGYGFYRYCIHVAGNSGGHNIKLGPNAGPFAYAYTDEEEEMIRNAVKALGGRVKELTPRGSKEADDINKTSAVANTDWKKVK